MTRECAVATVFVIAAAVPGATERSQRPTFSARVETVRVDALVTENGQPVPGLGPADFEVFDNGVRQDVELVSFEQEARQHRRLRGYDRGRCIAIPPRPQRLHRRFRDSDRVVRRSSIDIPAHS